MGSGYTEDDIAMVFNTIVKDMAIRKADLNYEISRTILQSHI